MHHQFCEMVQNCARICKSNQNASEISQIKNFIVSTLQLDLLRINEIQSYFLDIL